MDRRFIDLDNVADNSSAHDAASFSADAAHVLDTLVHDALHQRVLYSKAHESTQHLNECMKRLMLARHRKNTELLVPQEGFFNAALADCKTAHDEYAVALCEYFMDTKAAWIWNEGEPYPAKAGV
jgi:hypothetical protein